MTCTILQPAPSSLQSCLVHIYDTPYAIASLHIRKSGVDLIQRLPVRDEFVHLEFPSHIIVHEVWELATAFDAAECATFPDTAGD